MKINNIIQCIVLLFGIFSLLGCTETEKEKQISCSLTTADFTYERIGAFQYQIKLKDPNKPHDRNLFWHIEDLGDNCNLEPTINFKYSQNPLGNKMIKLYATKDPQFFVKEKQCGEIILKPEYTSPTCDDLRVTTSINEIHKHSNPPMYGLVASFSIPYNSFDDNIYLEFINGYKDHNCSPYYNSYPAGELNPDYTNSVKCTTFIPMDKLKDALYVRDGNLGSRRQVYLLATLTIKYKNGMTCVKDVGYNVNAFHPELF